MQEGWGVVHQWACDMINENENRANWFRLARGGTNLYNSRNTGVFMFVRFALGFLVAVLVALPAHADDLDVMIGQMLMAGFRGYTVDEDSPIIKDIKERHLGGVILFDYDVELGKPERNIKNPEQVRRLTRDLWAVADISLFIAVDQEGGQVQRLKHDAGFKETFSAQVLGRMEDDIVFQAAYDMGKQLQELGFNLNFAPVADVNANPDSPAIGKLGRSFSRSAARVAECNRLFLEAMDLHHVWGCLKHFPGHGSAGTDSHLGVTDVSDTWGEDELQPYETLISMGRVEFVMTGHIFNAKLDPEYPATLSRKTITGLLRNKLGFSGVVITDDMNMKAITSHYGQEEAIRLAIEAGADILLFGNNLTYDPDVVKKAHSIIRKLVDSGIIPKERIYTSYSRIMRLKGVFG